MDRWAEEERNRLIDRITELERQLNVAREALEEIGAVGEDHDCSDCRASSVIARRALANMEQADD